MSEKETQKTEDGAQEQPKKTTRQPAAKKTTTAKKATTAKKKPAAKKKTTKAKKEPAELPEDIWEQWPEERADQYLKFCAYRDMAYEGRPEINATDCKNCRKLQRRSLRKLAASYKLKRHQPFGVLSVKFKWEERAEAYDKYLEKKVREVHESAILKMAENHALLGEQMVKKAAKRILTIPEEEISAAEVARLADVGVKIERLSRGQSTENQSVTGTVEHEGEIKVKKEPDQDLSNLTNEELEQLERLLEKAQKKND